MKRVALLVLLAACGSATDVGQTTLQLGGTWTYTAVQLSPAANMSGTLVIAANSGAAFTGSASFSETDALGVVRQRAGQLSGQAVGSNAVDFDVFVDNDTRRHVARVEGDSMTGTWAIAGGTSGSFKAKKR